MGSDHGSSKMLGEISDQAAKLMGDAVKSMTGVVDKIAKTANEAYDTAPRNTGYGQGQSVISKRGLSSTDKKTLEDVVATCKDIEGAAEQLAQGSDEKGAPATRPAAHGASGGDSIATVQQQASALRMRAENMLNGDYSDRSNNPGTGGNQQQQQPRPGQAPPPPRN
jgi:hypothetical protein